MIIGEPIIIGNSDNYPSVFFHGDDLTSSGNVIMNGQGNIYDGVWINGTTSGHIIHRINSFGAYSYTATQGSKTKSGTININELNDYDINIDFRTYLYNQGDECTSLTGGWIRKYNYDGTGTLTKNATNMQLTCYRRASYGYGLISICTNNKIDLTNYSSLNIEFINESETYRRVELGTTNTKNDSHDYVAKSSDITSPWSWDISEITSEYYPYVLYSYSEDVTSTFTLTINKIWLE